MQKANLIICFSFNLKELDFLVKSKHVSFRETLPTFNMTEEGGDLPWSPVQSTLAGVGEGRRGYNIQNYFL